jgi:anti-anti-sigma regulatory factor
MTTATVIPHAIDSIAGSPETVLALPRRLDVHAVPPLRTRLDHLGLRPGRLVALDASAVTHVDRTGLAFLVEVRERGEAEGVDVTLTDVSLALRIALELTGLRGAPRRRDADVLADLDRGAA